MSFDIFLNVEVLCPKIINLGLVCDEFRFIGDIIDSEFEFEVS